VLILLALMVLRSCPSISAAIQTVLPYLVQALLSAARTTIAIVVSAVVLHDTA
jgi:hypothetical protein